MNATCKILLEVEYEDEETTPTAVAESFKFGIEYPVLEVKILKITDEKGE